MITRRTQVVEAPIGAPLPLADLLAEQRPVIFRGLARDWPLAVAGRENPRSAIDYLKRFDAGRPVVGYTGGPEIRGRYFYNDDLDGLNFQAQRVSLSAYLDAIASQIDASSSGVPMEKMATTNCESPKATASMPAVATIDVATVAARNHLV